MVFGPSLFASFGLVLAASVANAADLPRATAIDRTNVAGDIAKARATLMAMKPEWCQEQFADDEEYGDKAFEIEWKSKHDDADSPPLKMQLFKLFCTSGAYNVSYGWFRKWEDGLEPLAFAMPAFDIVYDGEGDDAKMKSVTVTGMDSTLILVNVDFDPAKLEISGTSCWRGLCDASSTGVWRFSEGGFSLTKYDVDGTYDGEINASTIYDAATR